MKLTRRELHILIVAFILAIVIVVIRPSYEIVKEWEMVYLFVVVFPLGIYLATDTERRESNNKK